MSERRDRNRLGFWVARKRGPRWLYRPLPLWATLLLLALVLALLIVLDAV